MIFPTSMISLVHSAYSRYDNPLIAKFSTPILSIITSLVNTTLDSDEFDSINVRIVSILRKISESMRIKFATEFDSMTDSREDSFVTKIVSTLYLERISEFLINSTKVDLPTPTPHTRAIY